MKQLYYITGLLFVFSISCTKKKYPESVIENDPVFYMKARINNVDYTYSAGINNYAMYASYSRDSNGVYNFIADLKQNGCGINCPGSMRIKINDSKVSAANEAADINNALSTRKYDLSMPQQYVQFQSNYNHTLPSGYAWDFGDGNHSTDANPSHMYLKRGTYKVTLTINDLLGCSSTISHYNKFGYADKIISPNIDVVSASGNAVSFSSSVNGGSAPYTYLWNFGDGLLSTGNAPQHVYKYAGSYDVTLRVIDARGDTSYTSYNAVTQTDQSSCAANFSLATIGSMSSPLNKALSEVSVIWTDEQGLVYESQKVMQPSGSAFEIISVADYENNENNQRTKKLKVRFNCSLVHNTSIIKIENAELVICVAYK